MFLLYHAYVYLEFLILACTIYILAPDVALENYGIDILKALQLRPIPPDEVNLTPKLIRFNH